jgi:hypothetical protein
MPVRLTAGRAVLRFDPDLSPTIEAQLMASYPPEPPDERSLYQWLVGDDIGTTPSDPWSAVYAAMESASAELLEQARARLAQAQSYEDVQSIRSLYQPHLANQDYNLLDKDAEERIVDIGFEPMVALIDSIHYPRDEDVRRVPMVSRRIDAIRDTLPIGQLRHDGRI